MVDTQQPTEHKESFFEKILDHHNHHNKHGNEGQPTEDKPQGGERGLRSDLKKDEKGLKKRMSSSKKRVRHMEA